MPETPLRRAATDLDARSAAMVERLLRLAVNGLAQMYDVGSDQFAFTRVPVHPHSSAFEVRGTSLRYSAIVALGAHGLAETEQRRIFAGRNLDDYLALLVRRVGDETNLGDAALICWAAAQAEHALLPEAVKRLRGLDDSARPAYVVEAGWVLSALAEARSHIDVEDHLAAARSRLLRSVVPGARVFPHTTAPGLVRPYRSHVACYADQVYSIQALARVHLSADDPEAIAAAEACAAQICRLQGEGGQWWWHYDARTGLVIEGYPVYTVHQHAMGPMALLDLADAGGTHHREAISRGLAWIAGPPELGPKAEALVLDDAAMTWRKVGRSDPRKLVRGLQAVAARTTPRMRMPVVGRVYRPDTIDRECRPYELGWLLFAWLAGARTQRVGRTGDDGIAAAGSSR